MKSEEILNEEEQDQGLPALTSILTSLYSSNAKEISYGDAYQLVYKLCKKGMADQIIQELIKVSEASFASFFEEGKDSSKVSASLVSRLARLRESMERVMEVLLYLETNYFQGIKREYSSIQELLNYLLFTQLCARSEVIEKVSREISEYKIEKNYKQADKVIGVINSLSDKDVFFNSYFRPVYAEVMSAHYRQLSNQNYETMELKQFLTTSRQILEEERQWLTAHFMRGRDSRPISELIQLIFEAIVNEPRARIYSEKDKELFEEASLEFIELLREKGEEEEINKHNEWFINRVKSRLESMSRTDNSQFLEEFVQYYQTISQILAPTKSLSIRYKSIFFFEQWINQEKVNLPKRLNIYAEEIILKQGTREASEAGQIEGNGSIFIFQTLFKLLKEKEFFEKEFRRATALRMIYQEYSIGMEDRLVALMSQECGKDWVEKIQKMREARSEMVIVPVQSSQSYPFDAIAYEDSVWPMDRGNLKGEVPKTLRDRAQMFVASYEQTFKGRKLTLHPFHGVVRLAIRFNSCVREFRMDTAMASVLLYLQEFGNKVSLANFYAHSKYSKDEIGDTIALLEKQGLIKLDKALSDSSASFALNLEFEPTPLTISDFTTRFTENILHHCDQEELKADRKMMVEAIIVKTMKKCKLATLPELFGLMRPLIECRGFQFNEGFVSNTLQGLVNKNYIRDLENGTFSYIAS